MPPGLVRPTAGGRMIVPGMRKLATRFAVAALTIAAAFAQRAITPPKIGEFTVGDDYFLANYTQLLDYWNKLAKESDRMKLVEIGKTAEGRPIMMAIIT